jgi:protein subunit release factor B
MQVKPGRKGFTLTKDDFRIEYYSGSGAGGQYRNKHMNCCRVIHDASGSVGTSQEHRDQPSNRETAFKRCVNSPVFKAWSHRKLEEIEAGGSVEEWVEEQLRPENLAFETKVGGKWVEWDGKTKE